MLRVRRELGIWDQRNRRRGHNGCRLQQRLCGGPELLRLRLVPGRMPPALLGLQAPRGPGDPPFHVHHDQEGLECGTPWTKIIYLAEFLMTLSCYLRGLDRTYERENLEEYLVPIHKEF